MKIYLVDEQKYFRVTFEEAKRILCSGLESAEWTLENILKYVLH